MEISLWSHEHTAGNQIQWKRVAENQLVVESDQKCKLCGSDDASCKAWLAKTGYQTDSEYLRWRQFPNIPPMVLSNSSPFN